MNRILLLIPLFCLVYLASAQNECYRVKYHTKISESRGNFTANLDPDDRIGRALATLGDFNNDGVDDIVAGAVADDDGGINRGAVYLLYMNANGTVQSQHKISNTTGNFTAPLKDGDLFGSSATNIGDLNQDNVTDIVVGAFWDKDGGFLRGAVYVLFLKSDGTVRSHQKISDLAGGFTGVLDNNDRFGRGVENIGDINNDGITDLAVAAHLDDDGGADRGAVWILFLDTNGTVKAHQKISSTTGGLSGPISNGDRFGGSIASIGDFNNDGIPDIAVGASRDDDGGTDKGAFYILMLDTNGTVKSEVKVSQTTGNFTGTIGSASTFGHEVTAIGDLNLDGTMDLIVTAPYDNDGGTKQGASWIVLLKPDGTVKNQFKISEIEGNFFGDLKPNDYFGFIAAGLGDYNHDGYTDVAIHAYADDGGIDKGVIWTLTLEPCPDTCVSGSQIAYQKIYRGDSSDIAYSIVEITGGGFLVAGSTNSGNTSSRDYFVMKTTAKGDTVWMKTYGGSADEGGQGINLQETKDGGFIIVGRTFSFGATNGNIYALKIDANGSIQWERSIGGATAGDDARSVIQTIDGGYLITGTNGYAVRLNNNGTTRWNKHYTSGSTTLHFNDVAETSYGDFILAGYAGYGLGNTSGWLVRIDSLGNKRWERLFDDGSTGGFTSVLAYGDGGYLACGQTATTASSSPSGILLLKCDSTGIFEWSRSYSGGTGLDRAVYVDKTSDGGIIISAYTENFSNNHNLLLRTDRYGNVEWSKAYPGNSNAPTTYFSNNVQETADGGFVLVNYSTAFTNSNEDIHLIKMNSCGESGCHEINVNLSITEMEPIETNPISTISTYGSNSVASSSAANISTSDTTLCEFDPKCQLSADFVADTVCQGDTTHFTDLSTDKLANVSQWNWDFGDGNSSNSIQNVNHLYASAGSYFVELKVVNNDTLYCADSISSKVIVKEFPSLNLGNDTVACQGDTLALDATDTLTTYLWQDNSTDPVYLVDTSGSYFVESDKNGCKISDTVAISFNLEPAFNIGPDTSICQGDTLMLDATVPSYTYRWQDNSTLPTYTVVTTGNYIVEVSDMLCTWEDSVNVVVKPNPVLNLGLDSTLCSGDSLLLDASNTGATYTWQNSSTDSVYLALLQGLYHVTVDLNGCLKTDSIVINFNTKPRLFLGNDTTICEGDTLTLDAFTPNYYYLWQDNSTQSSLAAFQGGTYFVTITDSVCTLSDSVDLIVENYPSIDLGQDTSICSKTSYVLSGFSPSGQYLWQDSSKASTYLVNGTGLYSLQISSTSGICKSSDSVIIEVDSIEEINIGNDTILCLGDTLVMDASSGAKSYQWQNGSIDSVQIAISEGLYRVISVNNSCSDTASIYVDFDSIPSLDLGEDVTICSGDSIVPDIEDIGEFYFWSTGDSMRVISLKEKGTYILTVTKGVCATTDSIGLKVNPVPEKLSQQLYTLCENKQVEVNARNPGATYRWSTGDTTQKITLNKTGLYSLQIINKEGCSISQDFALNRCTNYLFIPNTITPNGDGSNDTWIIRNIDAYPQNSVKIYNRNGHLLYDKKPYDNSWNGSFNGTELPESVYFYVLDLGNDEEVYRGTITVIREGQ